jgi:hypothetical protein
MVRSNLCESPSVLPPLRPIYRRHSRLTQTTPTPTNNIGAINNYANATINDPLERTYNRGALAGSDADIYKHNPWRAPGTAPVFDACGMAGGNTVMEGGEAKYSAAKFAQQGTLGSELPWVAFDFFRGSILKFCVSPTSNLGRKKPYLCFIHECSAPVGSSAANSLFEFKASSIESVWTIAFLCTRHHRDDMTPGFGRSVRRSARASFTPLQSVSRFYSGIGNSAADRLHLGRCGTRETGWRRPSRSEPTTAVVTAFGCALRVIR